MKIKVTMFRDNGELVHEQVHDCRFEAMQRFDRPVRDNNYEYEGYRLFPYVRPVQVLIDPDGTMEKIILALKEEVASLREELSASRSSDRIDKYDSAT